jgi:hypothetical protein
MKANADSQISYLNRNLKGQWPLAPARGCVKRRAWIEQILCGKLIARMTTGVALRKKTVVALARGFGVDWWRLCTGQTTPDKLGLVMAD